MCEQDPVEDDSKFLKVWSKRTLKEEALREERERIKKRIEEENKRKKEALRNKARRKMIEDVDNSGSECEEALQVEEDEEEEEEEKEEEEETVNVKSIPELASISDTLDDEIFVFKDELGNTYKKLEGHVDDAGLWYEVKMCALIYMKLLNLGAEFILGCNMAEVKGFDDVVAQYNYKNECDEYINKALFMQLKHAAKENTKRTVVLEEIKKNSSIFSIGKYFKEFKQNNNLNENKNFSTCKSDRTYIIYTNADVTRDFLEVDVEVKGLLNEITNKGEVLKLEKEKIKGFTGCEDKNVLLEFIATTRICCRQADIKEIDKLIKCEIRKAVTLSDSEANVVFSSFVSNIKYWYQNCSFYLTHDSKFWKHIVRKIEASRFNQREIELLKFGVQFNDEQVKHLRDQIDQNLGIMHVVCDGENTTATSLKVMQALRSVKPQDYILVSIEECRYQAENLWNTWCNEWCRVLVVDCKVDYSSTKVLTDKICAKIKPLSQNKVIIVSPKDHSWHKYLSEAPEKTYKKVQKNAQFSQFDEASQVKLLDKKINFQGAVIKLKHVLDNSKLLENVKSLGSDALSHLLCNDVIQIGKDIANLQTENKYVERYLEKPCLDQDCRSKNLILRERDLISKNESTVVVTAEPGMGKSTLLKNMAAKLKEHRPKMWVVFIDLSLHCAYFENMRDDDNKVNIMNIMNSTLNLNSIEQEFFNIFSHDLKNFIVLLDAFDEICPYYTEKVIKLVRYLSKNCHALYLTSRQNMKPYIEKQLSVEAYKLQPLTSIMTRDIIVNVWKNSLTNYSQEDLKRFSNALVSRYSELCRDSNKMFTSNPLHIKMLAEVYEKYIGNIREELDFALNILDLYNEFLEKCIREFFLNKKHADIHIPAGKYELENFRIDFENFNKIVAALQIFSNANVENVEGSETDRTQTSEYFKRLQNGFDAIGIIESISDNNVNYTHKSYAEYYTALWLAENRNYLSLLKEVIKSQEFETVRRFFDLKLAADNKLIISLLTEDESTLAKRLESLDNIDEVDSMERNALHLAAVYNKVELAKVLKDKISIYSKDEINWTPVKYAAETHSWEVLDLLLENINDDNNAIWDDIEYMKNDIIYISCIRYYKHIINYVGRKINLNQSFPIPKQLKNDEIDSKWSLGYKQNEDTFIPVHLAAEYENNDTLKFLGELGCNVGIENEYSQNILHIAACNGDMEILKYGIQMGINVNSLTNEENLCPLHIAYMEGHFDIIKKLVENNGNIKQETSNRDNILLLPAKHKNIEIIKYFIERGCDVNHINNKGDTPMIAAARRGHFISVQCFHDNNGNINYVNDKDGYSALLAATSKGYLSLVRYCSEHGCNKNQENTDGNTPLLCAALNGHLPVVKYLVGSGCDLHQVNNKDSYNALLCASQSGHLDIVMYCIENGCDVRYENSHGNTALLCASVNGHYDVVKYLVESGSDDINYVNKNDGYNALLLASEGGHLDIVKYCVEKGCDINHVNIYGNTALLCACFNGYFEVVKYLVDSGSDISFVNKLNGDTALLCAAESGYLDIVKLCVDNGTDVNSKNAFGNTPLLSASLKGHYDVVKYLTEQGAT